MNTIKLSNKTVLVQCFAQGWVLLIKEAEPSAYFVEGPLPFVPIYTVAPHSLSPVY